MKRLIVLLLLGVVTFVVAVLFLNRPSEITEVIKIKAPEPEAPAYPAEWLEEAEKAKADVIRRKELEKELEETKSKIAELDTRRVELEKELGTY